VNANSKVDFRALEAAIVKFAVNNAKSAGPFSLDVTTTAGRHYYQQVRPGFYFNEVDFLSLGFDPKLAIGKNNLFVLSGHANINLGAFMMEKDDTLAGHHNFGNAGFHIRSGWSFSVKDALVFTNYQEHFVYKYNGLTTDDLPDSPAPKGRINIKVSHLDFDLSTIIPPLSKNKLYLYAGWESFQDQVDYRTVRTETIKRYTIGGKINFKGFRK
jgi:hypothetical protein